MKEAAKELKELVIVLNGDIKVCLNSIPQDNNQFWKRTYIRSIFFSIEGITFALKQLALRAYEANSVKFSIEEITLLDEKSFELNDKGEAYSQNKHLNISKNLKFAFKSLCKAFSANYELNLSDNGWASFKDALEIRNRLTHPKRSEDLLVSDSELIKCVNAYDWFVDSVMVLIETITPT